ncbi:HAD family hydrolase [Isobaculum melis]|uniref:Haloacid dehalogenase superfamily, subfamily IA, variant 3 with third motif having DD or ED/haloacid dehalogenase superfamily, subfamily IA, variant 1 with third motif having Dx(3-4)D or Dx(3-4)E n=1 Tax=Isobaculum melis TaxID=142588 RepID=A0A1H9RJB4_9LACT|nr:HAD family phosphatase [Isobaculum melis]SER72635.1 haloacid dehalogenase superfamily, subfamily IA, variant 3 with third motif having DD or ED/haloacid dehalogenase superfamily, subfamily IA, variant 1 with third motif having Dx(3-4)D or Dx(3-4)E [Isobaculum melis]
MKAGVELVIFDMDGLMFDTEAIALEAWKRMAADYALKDTEAFYRTLIGKSMKSFESSVKNEFGQDIPIDEWLATLHDHHHHIIKENGTLGKKKGLIDLLDYLKTQSVKIAVASSSKHDEVVANVNFEGIAHYFDFIIGGDEVHESKPNPEIFQRPCQHFGIAPENAMVLEDSINGFLAAQAAGIPLYFIPDLLAPTEAVKQGAYGIFDSLLAVKEYLSKNDDEK